MKLKYDKPLSNFAFKSNLRCYNLAQTATVTLFNYPLLFLPIFISILVRRCSLTLSNPR